jgi:hypothetical protein
MFHVHSREEETIKAFINQESQTTAAYYSAITLSLIPIPIKTLQSMHRGSVVSLNAIELVGSLNARAFAEESSSTPSPK